MQLNTTAILIFFAGGILLHIFSRQVYAWNEKEQPWFWLICMSIFAINIFVTPKIIDKSTIVEAINIVVAGVCFTEYMRNRYKRQIERILHFQDEVEQWKQKKEQKKQDKTKQNKR